MKQVKRFAGTGALVVLLLFLPCVGRADDIVKIMRLLGCESEEQLREDEVERYSRLLEHPLDINSAGRAALEKSGLFTGFQIASLLEYRQLSGSLMSLAELALVDGFSREKVEMLEGFISLDDSEHPFARRKGTEHELTTRVATKCASKKSLAEGGDFMYAAKYTFSHNRFSLSAGMKRPYGSETPLPGNYSFSAEYMGSKVLSSLIVGDFNARFGQGLAMWSGFAMSGFTSSSSFMRKASGISASHSYSGAYSMRGLAAELSLGKGSLSFVTAFDGLVPPGRAFSIVPAVNWNCNGSWYSYSVTSSAVTGELPLSGAAGNGKALEEWKIAADWRACVKGTDIFAEVAFELLKLSPAAVLGSIVPLNGRCTVSSVLRYYPADFSSLNSGAVRTGSKNSNEYGATLGFSSSSEKRVALKGRQGFGSSRQKHIVCASFDACYYPRPPYQAKKPGMQFKLFADWQIQVNPVLAIQLRVTERLRNWLLRSRTSARLELKYELPEWVASARTEYVFGRSSAFMAFAEGGYRTERLALWLKSGWYNVPNWDDRIYVYNRDAPGNFSSTALYGRGFWTSAYVSLKTKKTGNFYLSLNLRPSSPTEKIRHLKASCAFQWRMMFR